MRAHPNAEGSPYQRRLMIRRIEEGCGVAAAYRPLAQLVRGFPARAFGIEGLRLSQHGLGLVAGARQRRHERLRVGALGD